MKKGILISILCVFFLTACAQKKNELFDVTYEPTISETVKITTEKESYSKTDTTIRYSIMNTGNVEEGIAADHNCFELQKWEEGRWKRVGTKVEHYWTALGLVLESGAVEERELQLNEYFYLPLEAGEYRIVVESYVSNSFTISK